MGKKDYNPSFDTLNNGADLEDNFSDLVFDMPEELPESQRNATANSIKERVKTLIPQGNGRFHFPVGDKEHIELSDIGIDFKGLKPSPEEFTYLAGLLIAMGERIQLWIGDCLNAFKRVHGVTYAQFAEQYDLAKGTLYDYAYVADRVQISIRIENLTYSHYRLIAAQDEHRRKYWVGVASQGDPLYGENGEKLYVDEKKTILKRAPLTVAELREKIDAEKDQDGVSQAIEEVCGKEPVSRLYKIINRLKKGGELSLDDIQWVSWWADRFDNVSRKNRSSKRVTTAIKSATQK